MNESYLTYRLPTTMGLLILGLTVLGAIVAIVLDVPSSFVIGDAQIGDLGIEVIWQGSAISAPFPPIVVTAIGVLLARRTGKARTAGLVLLTLVGAMMLLGVVGEFSGDTAFDGLRQGLFVLFNALYGALAIALIASSLLAIFRRGVYATA